MTQLPNGELLRSVTQAAPGERLDIIVRDGRVAAEVRKVVAEKTQEK